MMTATCSSDCSAAVASIAVFCLCLLFSGCSASTDTNSETNGEKENSEPVQLALNWYAEAEHGGYIAADERGLFREVGLQVDIREGGPGAPSLVIQELAAGRISFAVSNADLIVLARSQQVPLVAVAAPLQQSPRCIMVHQSSGIQSLEELQNVELAISDGRPFALWMKKKLPLTNVTMVPYTGQVGEFVVKANFAQQGYVFSEPFLAEAAGSDPHVLMLSDIGFNPYGSLLVTTEDMIASRPDVVRSMVQASVEGWVMYLDAPDSTNRRIHESNDDMSLEALSFGAKAMRPLCQPDDGQPLCGMTTERWQTLIDQIVEIGEIEAGQVNAADCFDTSFLPPGERGMSIP